MSQQINLYNPALRRQRELLSATTVALAGLGLALVIGAWGAAVRSGLAARQAEAASLAPQVKAAQEQMAAMAKAIGQRQADAALQRQLAEAEEALAQRNRVKEILARNAGPGAVSFAEYLRGLARRIPKGVWLTGFTANENGGLEIRGRMTDPALIPEYIQRLNEEPVFRGQSFAALRMDTPEADKAPASSGAATPETKARSTAPAFHEFSLVPMKPVATDRLDGGPAAAPSATEILHGKVLAQAEPAAPGKLP